MCSQQFSANQKNYLVSYRPVQRDNDFDHMIFIMVGTKLTWERSGSVVEYLTRDRGRMFEPTDVTGLWSLSKTHLS